MNYSIEDKLRVASSNVELETFKATSKLEKDLQNFGSEHHKSLMYSYIAEYIRIRANALDDIVKDIPSEEVFKDTVDTMVETFFDKLIPYKEALKLAKSNNDLGVHNRYDNNTEVGDKPFLDSLSNEFLFKYDGDLSIEKVIEIANGLTEDSLTDLRFAINDKFNAADKPAVTAINLDTKIPDDCTTEQIISIMKEIFGIEPAVQVKESYGKYIGTIGYFTEVFNVVVENICRMYLDDVDDDEEDLAKYPYMSVVAYIGALFDNLLIIILHSVKLMVASAGTFELYFTADLMTTLQPIIDRYGILNKNR